MVIPNKVNKFKNFDIFGNVMKCAARHSLLMPAAWYVLKTLKPESVVRSVAI